MNCRRTRHWFANAQATYLANCAQTESQFFTAAPSSKKGANQYPEPLGEKYLDFDLAHLLEDTKTFCD